MYLCTLCPIIIGILLFLLLILQEFISILCILENLLIYTYISMYIVHTLIPSTPKRSRFIRKITVRYTIARIYLCVHPLPSFAYVCMYVITCVIYVDFMSPNVWTDKQCEVFCGSANVVSFVMLRIQSGPSSATVTHIQ